MATTTFSMRIDEALKQALEKHATGLERSSAWVAQQAISGYLAREQAMIEAVRDALDNDDGKRTSGEAILAWMGRWAEGHDDPMPEPDIFESPFGLKKSA
jgi:predicted transcriptional regulator